MRDEYGVLNGLGWIGLAVAVWTCSLSAFLEVALDDQLNRNCATDEKLILQTKTF